MRSISAADRCASQLNTIGDAVLPLLKAARIGEVVARFEHSAYLEFSNEWVCLALPSLGAGPTVLQLDGSVTELHEDVQVGAPVIFDAHRFIRMGDYTIDVDGANPYSGLLTTHHINRQQVCRWARVFQESPMSVGLAPFLGQIDFSASNLKPWDSIVELNRMRIETAQIECVSVDAQANELLMYVAPAMQSLLSWVHDVAVLDTPTEPSREITRLLGAGPGLTPSGDDFLAGVLCALHVSGNRQVMHPLCSVLLANAQEYTTPVSASLLKQACAGRINEHAHQLVHCVLLSAEVDAAVLQGSIQRMGASSGWDFLTGLILGVLASDV